MRFARFMVSATRPVKICMGFARFMVVRTGLGRFAAPWGGLSCGNAGTKAAEAAPRPRLACAQP